MHYLYKVYFSCVLLVVLNKDASADKEDKSDETIWRGEKSPLIPHTLSSSPVAEQNNEDLLANDASEIQDSGEMTEGPPDSHEAMNNREINPITKTRQKRSYEFLMGLINNNSRYQVTRDEPSINLSKKQGNTDEDIVSSEPLLELMVKIAADPDQWSKVHNLLRQIDQDILTSKQLLEKHKNHTNKVEGSANEDQIEEHISTTKMPEEKKKKKYIQEEINKEIAMTSDNGQPDISPDFFSNYAAPTISSKEWPMFNHKESKVNFFNDEFSSNSLTSQTKPVKIGPTTTKAYPKYFSYHRVTGKPIFVNRNPKAYIAVSVVAPKSSDISNDEDLELEHELRQLKPWTHSQNLRNMESIRSRWVIDSKGESKMPAKS